VAQLILEASITQSRKLQKYEAHSLRTPEQQDSAQQQEGNDFKLSEGQVDAQPSNKKAVT